MSGYDGLPGYDAWKTSEPDDEPYGECDCCGRKAPLHQLWAYGTETWACEECCDRDPDAKLEERRERERDDMRDHYVED